MHHHWQDIVLAAGALIFSAALVPSIISEHKPALLTSGLTFCVLAVYTVTYASLSLWYTTFAVGLNALFWGILAIQKIRQSK
jgi:hypothetical protein